MDILSVILEGRGGGKKPKNILRHSYRNIGIVSLVQGGGVPFRGVPNDIRLPHSEP